MVCGGKRVRVVVCACVCCARVSLGVGRREVRFVCVWNARSGTSVEQHGNRFSHTGFRKKNVINPRVPDGGGSRKGARHYSAYEVQIKYLRFEKDNPQTVFQDKQIIHQVLERKFRGSVKGFENSRLKTVNLFV